MKKFSFYIVLVVLAIAQVANAAQPTSPVVVQAISTVPTVKPSAEWDGTPDAIWANVPWNDISVIFKAEASGFTDADDLTGRFKVAHDADNVYFLFDITDELIVQDPAQHWVGDKVEIYFGLAGYDKALGANKNHARQFAIKAQMDPTPIGQEGSANYAPLSDALETNGVTYSYAESAVGYMLQVTINKAIALENVPNGTAVAFDVCVADNDEGAGPGIRYRKSWFNDGEIKELWAEMSGAGQLIFSAPSGLKDVSQTVEYSLKNNVLNVNTHSNVNITIFDMTGKSVLASSNSNKVNVASLNAGIYVATLKSVDGNLLGNFRFFK